MTADPGSTAEGAADDAAGGEASESLALTVCRLTLETESGRIRHQTHAGVAIRAALFVELLMDERLAGAARPVAVGPSETGNKLADSVHRAVATRGALPWKRWFGHVQADLDAATHRLIESGQWVRPGGAVDGRTRNGARFLDAYPALTATQTGGVAGLLSSAQTTNSAAFAVQVGTANAAVALLATGAGPAGERPRPKVALSRLDSLLPSERLLTAAGYPCVADQDAIRAVVSAALVAMRGRAGSRFFSG
ncbi:GPP34 family phosphoprotein [Jatrophihabitans sp. DSM 45814]